MNIHHRSRLAGRLFCLAAGLLLGTHALADDLQRGEQLHAQNCVSCHTSMVGGDGSLLYTRADRKVNNREQLISRVNQCETTLELQWFEEDVMAVVEYLDRNHYKF